MATTGLTAEQLMGEHQYKQATMIFTGSMCLASLVNPKYYSSLGTQMFLLNKWYLKVIENDEVAWLVARVRPEL